jgi:hypothetical protein
LLTFAFRCGMMNHHTCPRLEIVGDAQIPIYWDTTRLGETSSFWKP